MQRSEKGEGRKERINKKCPLLFYSALASNPPAPLFSVLCYNQHNDTSMSSSCIRYMLSHTHVLCLSLSLSHLGSEFRGQNLRVTAGSCDEHTQEAMAHMVSRSWKNYMIITHVIFNVVQHYHIISSATQGIFEVSLQPY